MAVTPVRARSAPVAPARQASGPPTMTLRDDALASYGWPAGTRLTLDPRRRPQRGDLAVVREGTRVSVGIFERQLGRAVLTTDAGSIWLGPGARHVGVATQAQAPLVGMPDDAAMSGEPPEWGAEPGR